MTNRKTTLTESRLSLIGVLVLVKEMSGAMIWSWPCWPMKQEALAISQSRKMLWFVCGFVRLRARFSRSPFHLSLASSMLASFTGFSLFICAAGIKLKLFHVPQTIIAMVHKNNIYVYSLLISSGFFVHIVWLPKNTIALSLYLRVSLSTVVRLAIKDHFNFGFLLHHDSNAHDVVSQCLRRGRGFFLHNFLLSRSRTFYIWLKGA